MYKIHFVSQ